MTLINFNYRFATPEKWDSISRKWKDFIPIIGQIGLLLIDEGCIII